MLIQIEPRTFLWLRGLRPGDRVIVASAVPNGRHYVKRVEVDVVSFVNIASERVELVSGRFFDHVLHDFPYENIMKIPGYEWIEPYPISEEKYNEKSQVLW